MPTETSGFTAEGEQEAARANALCRRQAEATAAVRNRYAARMAAARWPRKLLLWVEMQAAVRRAEARVKRELAPREGLYLRDVGER